LGAEFPKLFPLPVRRTKMGTNDASLVPLCLNSNSSLTGDADRQGDPGLQGRAPCHDCRSTGGCLPNYDAWNLPHKGFSSRGDETNGIPSGAFRKSKGFCHNGDNDGFPNKLSLQRLPGRRNHRQAHKSPGPPEPQERNSGTGFPLWWTMPTGTKGHKQQPATSAEREKEIGWSEIACVS
jgi:hypothetical protein